MPSPSLQILHWCFPSACIFYHSLHCIKYSDRTFTFLSPARLLIPHLIVGWASRPKPRAGVSKHSPECQVMYDHDSFQPSRIRNHNINHILNVSVKIIYITAAKVLNMLDFITFYKVKNRRFLEGGLISGQLFFWILMCKNLWKNVLCSCRYTVNGATVALAIVRGHSDYRLYIGAIILLRQKYVYIISIVIFVSYNGCTNSILF